MDPQQNFSQILDATSGVTTPQYNANNINRSTNELSYNATAHVINAGPDEMLSPDEIEQSGLYHSFADSVDSAASPRLKLNTSWLGLWFAIMVAMNIGALE